MGLPALKAVINWVVVIEQARGLVGRQQADAWATIYSAFEKELRALIKSLCGRRWWSEVEDMLHDVIVAARRDFHGFAVVGDDPRASLQNWLFAVTRHHVGRYIQRRRRETPDDEAVERAEATVPGDVSLRKVTEQMLEDVQDEDVLLSFCRGIEELSYAEVVAEIEAFRSRQAAPETTGLSEEALRSRWMRLRERFKAFLRDKITGPWQARSGAKT